MSSGPLNDHDHDSVSPTCYSRYNSDIAVGQYCDAHYGPDRLGLPNFSVELVRLCLNALDGMPLNQVLDLGCAVGRSSFELARCCTRVTAIDYSTRFITLARRIQEKGQIRYQLVEEGEMLCERVASLAECGLTNVADRVAFHQGDAQHLGARYCNYELVLAANLVDRLPAPGRFLRSVHKQLVIGGLLALASPYNWLEEFTPRKNWLGVRYLSGVPQTSMNTITRHLDSHFELLGGPQEIPFTIRETARKYTYNIAQLSFWRRVR